MAGERVTRISPTTWEIVTETATDYVGFCTIHHTVTSDPVVHLRDVQPCSLCREEARARRHRDGYVRLLMAERLGAALLVLLCATAAQAAEGYILPTSHAAEIAARPSGHCRRGDGVWEKCGPSKKWIALAWLGQGLDLVSTEIVLRRGGVELNPLMKHGAVRWTVKPLMTAGTTWGLGKVPRSVANGVAKTAFWTGFLPGTANTIQTAVKK